MGVVAGGALEAAAALVVAATEHQPLGREADAVIHGHGMAQSSQVGSSRGDPVAGAAEVDLLQGAQSARIADAAGGVAAVLGHGPDMLLTRAVAALAVNTGIRRRDRVGRSVLVAGHVAAQAMGALVRVQPACQGVVGVDRALFQPGGDIQLPDLLVPAHPALPECSLVAPADKGNSLSSGSHSPKQVQCFLLRSHPRHQVHPSPPCRGAFDPISDPAGPVHVLDGQRLHQLRDVFHFHHGMGVVAGQLPGGDLEVTGGALPGAVFGCIGIGRGGGRQQCGRKRPCRHQDGQQQRQWFPGQSQSLRSSSMLLPDRIDFKRVAGHFHSGSARGRHLSDQSPSWTGADLLSTKSRLRRTTSPAKVN